MMKGNLMRTFPHGRLCSSLCICEQLRLHCNLLLKDAVAVATDAEFDAIREGVIGFLGCTSRHHLDWRIRRWAALQLDAPIFRHAICPTPCGPSARLGSPAKLGASALARIARPPWNGLSL
jgi:hypothetical protein